MSSSISPGPRIRWWQWILGGGIFGALVGIGLVILLHGARPVNRVVPPPIEDYAGDGDSDAGDDANSGDRRKNRDQYGHRRAGGRRGGYYGDDGDGEMPAMRIPPAGYKRRSSENDDSMLVPPAAGVEVASLAPLEPLGVLREIIRTKIMANDVAGALEAANAISDPQVRDQNLATAFSTVMRDLQTGKARQARGKTKSAPSFAAAMSYFEASEQQSLRRDDLKDAEPPERKPRQALPTEAPALDPPSLSTLHRVAQEIKDPRLRAGALLRVAQYGAQDSAKQKEAEAIFKEAIAAAKAALEAKPLASPLVASTDPPTSGPAARLSSNRAEASVPTGDGPAKKPDAEGFQWKLLGSVTGWFTLLGIAVALILKVVLEELAKMVVNKSVAHLGAPHALGTTGFASGATLTAAASLPKG